MEALRYAKNFYQINPVNTLAHLKNSIELKISQFTRDKDKLDFLKILRIESEKQLQEHLLNCKKGDCKFHKDREYGFFAIDQEIDSINEFYRFEPQSNDKFSAVEEASLHEKLNIIIENLEKVGLANEIIYNEIDSLKCHFNLGKTNWFQLVKGKFFDLVLEKAIEKSMALKLFDSLIDGNFTQLQNPFNK